MDDSMFLSESPKRSSMSREIISTDRAPSAIGTYSQAIRTGNWIFLSGQIPLDPESMDLVQGDIEAQVSRVLDNLRAVAQAAGGDLSDLVKLTVFLTDLKHFPVVNEVMARYFREPYPARAAVSVAALPRGAAVEIDAIMVLAR
jgi:reactive intermediate/imine deaminase